MADPKTLEKKVNELEERLKKLEDTIFSPKYSEERILMEALYKKARELVVNHNKASVMFIQRKLLIDFARASAIMEELEANGVIGPAVGAEPRQILMKK